MSRSGWIECDDWDRENVRMHNILRANVRRCIRSKKGQAFLVELAAVLDSMPEKRLIADNLVDEDGDVCAIGAVCKARGLDVSTVDYECPDQVAELVGIKELLVSEIEWASDDMAYDETPEKRWRRMRRWVQNAIVHCKNINKESGNDASATA